MNTITFYSYKGGSGRSLALANAAIYLAKFGFTVVTVDLDLEAPGLHYKFSGKEDGTPLKVERGVVDYIISFLTDGEVRAPLSDFMVTPLEAGVENNLIRLMPAGRVPSVEYWSKLSQIDWHDLFYKKGAKGVQIFRELQKRILDEFNPDFLLIDARTGITEMGGVATTLLADKVLCLVLPTLENLEGARAVLRSLKNSRRSAHLPELELMIAVSRLPEMASSEGERTFTEWILSVLNKPADDPSDSLNLKSIFVLHSDAALQFQESLRVGSGTNPDESLLLRDYLRLFATFIPNQLIDAKVHDLIDRAWEQLRHDPDAAIKEMEALAESFPHPENYRELLRFYRARNVEPALMLRRAQRLWEITRDSSDSYLWEVIARSFEPRPRYPRTEGEWRPDLSFVRSVWRRAGKKDPKFGTKLADAYNFEDEESIAADVLNEIIESSGASPSLVARSISMLNMAKRTDEAEALIQRYKDAFAPESEFATAWARHALRTKSTAALIEITKSSAIEKLRPTTMAMVYSAAGMADRAIPLAETMLKELRQKEVSPRDFEEIGQFFNDLGRWDEFEKVAAERYPTHMLSDLRDRLGKRRVLRRPH
jgi:MinD-like ATPase involved in chromosome partitioning or flagellar assembly